MGVTEFKRKENDGDLQREPLLMEEHKTRFVLFPIKHNDVSEVCRMHQINVPLKLRVPPVLTRF